MKSFKQYLNQLEKQRKSIGYFPNVVHGSHAGGKKINEDNSSDKTGFLGHIDDFTSGVDGENLENTLKLDKTLQSHYKPSLSNHEMVGHVTRYTTDSEGLNRHLIAEHKGELENYNSLPQDKKEERNELNERSDKLSQAISSHPAPMDFNTYSGLGFDPRKHMNKDGSIHSPAFISSSIEAGCAFEFARPTGSDQEYHILEIPVKKGSTRGAYIESHSDKPGESEFLHNKGQNFKLSNNPKMFYHNYNINGKEIVRKVHVWRAEPTD
jgi:hypothetical protein